MKSKMKIKKMDEKLFIQRRRVIELLYEARKIIGTELPRIKVRIVDFNNERSLNTGGRVLGKCFINKDYIVISDKIVDWDQDFLRHIVWHELCHAYFSATHDDNCPLMSPTVSTPASCSSLTKALKKYAKINLKKAPRHEETIMQASFA